MLICFDEKVLMNIDKEKLQKTSIVLKTIHVFSTFCKVNNDKT